MPPAKKPATKKRASTQKWIRNTRGVQVSIRLDTGRRIELLPRGRRGDAVPVSAAEMKDEKFILNKGLLFEIITENEAVQVAEKQDTNRLQVHPAMSQIRNAKGEKYEGDVKMETEEQAQGTVVGQVDDRGMITRSDANGTTDNPIRVTSEEKLDEVARRTDLEGPEAGIGDIKVTKESVQRT